MGEIGIGIVGGGYMGKAHAVAMSAVGAVFDTGCGPAGNGRRLARFGRTLPRRLRLQPRRRDWQELVARPAGRGRHHRLAAIHPPRHCRGRLRARQAGVCEKPLGASLDDSRAMVARGRSLGAANMVGFNYIRTPASRFARKLIAEGAIGDITWFRGEHTEDFYADPQAPPAGAPTAMPTAPWAISPRT
jgi:predicted dehydrogenase